MRFITSLDFLLLPFYLIVIYLAATKFRDKHYPVGHPWRVYFIPGLTVKIFGALFIGLLYQYYYNGGDTANYFTQSSALNTSFNESPLKWLMLILHVPQWYDGRYIEYISQIYWYDNINSFTVVAVGSLIGMFTFNTFLPTSIFFAVISFTGLWALFRTFAVQYPDKLKPIGIATLFIPSTFIWGSGIFKDTICMFAMGWMIYGTFDMLIRRKFGALNITMTITGFYLLAVIKIYILLAFIPALSLWTLLYYSQRIKYGVIRVALKLLIAGAAIAGFLLFSQSISSKLGSYSLDNIAQTSNTTMQYINSVSGAESSGYTLGKFDPTIEGMLSQFPGAVNVTLFRPYLWEAKKPIVLINAIEAFIFLLVTLRIIFVIGLPKIWIAINKDANIQFCLIFTFIFAFAVGISSGNFGALSRYRIPCLPLYALALVLIYYRYTTTDKKFLWFI